MLPHTRLSGNARRLKTLMGMSLREFDLLFAKMKAHPGAERLSKRPRSRARRTARQRVWAARMRTSRSTNPGRGDLLPICGGTGPEAPASEKPAQPCCRRSRVPCMSRDGHDGNAKRQRCAQAKRQHVEVLRGMGGPVCTLGQNHWGNWRRQDHRRKPLSAGSVMGAGKERYRLLAGRTTWKTTPGQNRFKKQNSYENVRKPSSEP